MLESSMNRTIYLQLLLYPIILLFILSAILTTNHILHFKENAKEAMDNTKQRYTKDELQNIKERVEEVVTKVKLHNNLIEKELKKRIKVKVDNSVDILDNLYKIYKDKLSKEELEKLLLNYINSVKFKNEDGFFFVTSLNTHKILSHKKIPNMLGKDMTNYIDKNGMKLFLSKKEILKKQDSGYQKVYFKKPDDIINEYEKIVYFRKFKPFNWMIGTGEYTQNVKKDMQNLFLSKLKITERNRKDDIFILQLDDINNTNKFAKILISKDKPDFENSYLPKNIVEDVFNKNFIDNLIQNGTAIKKYKFNQYSKNRLNTKNSYFYYYEPWNWIVASGFYYEDLEKLINYKQNKLNKKLGEDITNSILITLLLILLTAFISYMIISKVISIIEKNDKTISVLNDTLSKKVKEQVSQIRFKDIILSQKLKNEALGEMLGIITHQYRQPLNNINSIVSKLYIDCKTDNITVNKSLNCIHEIENTTQYMSKIITDFSDFYNQSNTKEVFSIKEAINSINNILYNQSNIANKPIIDIDGDHMIYHGNKGSFQQVIVALINNSIENYNNKNINKYKIDIKITKVNDIINIVFKDYGGGIKKELLGNLFDMFITTKSDKKLRGLGLYMVKTILKEHFNANIAVENINNSANFTIWIPDDKKI